MKSPIYIFGHKNPDTDSICSAIAYTALKRRLGLENAMECRLGELNKETEFVLEYFQAKKPFYLPNVRTKLRDLNLYTPIKIEADQPLIRAWDFLKTEDSGARLMPVVDAKGKLDGIISIENIAKIFMEPYDEELVEHYEIRFDNLVEILGGKIVTGTYNYEKLCGTLHIGSAIDSEDKLCDKDIVITGRVKSARYYANERECGCVILTNDYYPLELEKARCAVICVRHSMTKTVTLINQAISVGSVMQKSDFEIFYTESHIEDIIDSMKTSAHRNFPVLDRQGRLFGIISRRHLIEYDRKRVILVDHNEKHQSVDGLEQADILEIIDHHRIADIETDKPLYVRAEPVGCTATIIYKLYKEHGMDIDKKNAGLLLAAILSDTLMFRSPSCTVVDKSSAEELAAIAEVNIDEFGTQMFQAGASMENQSVKEILMIDRKQFSIGKYSVYISQINTLDLQSILTMKKEILEGMLAFCEHERCDLFILLVTDIIKGGSEILLAGNAKELAAQAFNTDISEEQVYLPGVVSRKMQIVPRLMTASQIINTEG